MPQQAEISARNQRAGLAQERLDGVASGRILPSGAIKDFGSEQDLRDVLLGRAVAKPIDGAQHALRAGALLRRYPCVGRDGALALPHQECYRLWSLPHVKCYRPMAPHQILLGQELLPFEASDAPCALRPT